MVTTITPIEIDGKHFVEVTFDDHKMKPYGPYDAGTVEAIAARIAATCRSLGQHTVYAQAPTTAQHCDP